MDALRAPVNPRVTVSHIPVAKGSLYCREIGQGRPISILHGGPDFDHTYLLPDLDVLGSSFRLIYHDQRGRGRSADNVQPEDVSLEGEMDDLTTILDHRRVDHAVLLGHSWGALLALEYATRNPDRVSHLILMNPSPASTHTLKMVRDHREATEPDVIEALRAMASTPAYQDADPGAVEAYYRQHFRNGVARPDDLERVIDALRASFTDRDVLKARAIEDRLMELTWLSGDYDLHPRLETLQTPALIIHGDHDLIPWACVEPIANALQQARIVRLERCGHFAYLERPDQVEDSIKKFLS